MKVYVKKGESQSIIIVIIVAIVFITFPLGTFYAFWNEYQGASIFDILSNIGFVWIILLFFFIIGIIILFALLKRPTKHTLTLISKEYETYNGQEITYMSFKGEKKKKVGLDLIPIYYNCYTYDNNDLKINEKYIATIQNSTWKIKEIIGVAPNNEESKKLPHTIMWISFIGPLIMIVSLIINSILGLIFYKQYTFWYICTLLCYLIVLFTIIKFIRRLYPNNNTKSKDSVNLSKYKTLHSDGKKIKNLAIKDALKWVIIVPLIWLFILLIISIRNNTNYITIRTFFPILCPEFVLLLSLISSYYSEQHLTKKYNLNTENIFNIKDIKNFNIFRANKDLAYEKYFIIDNNNNLLYNIQKAHSFGYKYIVSDSFNNKIAEIRRKFFAISLEYIVSIIDKPPFIVREDIHLCNNYSIYGLDYNVKGDMRGIQNYIYDNKENIIASINRKNRIGNTEIKLNNIPCNLNIVLISACVTIGNFSKLLRNFND